MPSYKIEFTKSAKKEFDHLPRKIQEKVIEAVNILSLNPFTEFLQVKKLKGASHLYRLRIGDYRVVYEIRGQILSILIIKIGDRKDIYRFLK